MSNLSTSANTGNPRNKTALKPGRSLMDWIKLTNSSTDLSGTGNRLRDISPNELAQHNSKNDAWLAIRGSII
jgi:cytochrome-b5 reductase